MVEDLCDANGGTWRTDGCPHEGLMGACLLNEHGTTESETFYNDSYESPFAPSPIDAARGACEAVGGAWS